MSDSSSHYNNYSEEQYPGESLDQPNLNVKEYFKDFIKYRSIEELISFDNKIFSELRNLDSEKHILVTQNYKKFVTATETINTIKSSLSDFEKDLNVLQSKITNLVDNYSVINSSIDDKLKESEKIYKIKKDLKKLKTVNDLPNILENQLNEYSALAQIGKKDIKILEKALIYYERCKDFIRHHKDNSLVKDIYIKTLNLIKKYQSIIHDELHISDFNDSNLEYFETCLTLLVKIEDDFSLLKTNLIDRFRYLTTKRYDEIFSMNEGVSEINFSTFSKIYDNYEFAINENEFLFYEHQLEEMRLKEKEANLTGLEAIQNLQGATADNKSDNSSTFNKINLISSQTSISNNLNLNVGNAAGASNAGIGTSGGTIDCKSLTSKFFKKGTFIWICKKINENVVGNYLISSFKLFTKLFGDEDLKHIENLFAFVIEIFFRKLNDIIEKNKDLKEIDPIFLKEGLSSFYYPFCEALQKINSKSINSGVLSQKILNCNEKILNNYLKNFYLNYVLDVAKVFSEASSKIFNNLNNNLKQSSNNNSNQNLDNNNEISSNYSGNTNLNNINNNILFSNPNINNIGNLLFNGFYASSTARIFLNNEISILNNNLQNLINEKINIIKKLEIQDILSLEEEDTNKIYFNNLISIYEIPFYVIKSFNIYKKDSLKFTIFYSSGSRNQLNKEEREAFEFDLVSTMKKTNEFLNIDKFIGNNLTNLYEKNSEKPLELKKEYEIIFRFLFILFVKSLENPKALNEKFLKNFPQIKSIKQMRNELTNHFEENIKISLFYLYESLIEIIDCYIFKKLKALFFDANLHNYENAITFRLPLRELLIELFHFKKKLLIVLEEEAKIYNESKLSTLNEALIHKKQRKLTKFQKEMECLSIRRLAIFNLNINEEIFPQTIMSIIVKIFLKNINEFVKLRKLNKQGFQQIQIDMNLVKSFFRENLIIDVDNILDGFFLEIMNNSSLNTKEAEIFDEQLLIEMIEEFKKEFKEINKAWDLFQQQ